MRYRLAAAVALMALLWLPYSAAPPPVQAATACTNWKNERVPPATIRVLRTSGPQRGRIQTVDLPYYVKIVLAAEWPPTYPTEALRAGAVAVKEYGWYYAMHWRGGTRGGACYDVVDNTNDQVFRPEHHSPSAAQVDAVDATWFASVTKNGSFMLTGYRSGAWVGCGSDADGWHMMQHSAYDCANQGLTYQQILHSYYDPGAVVWTPPTYPTTVFFSPPSGQQLMNRDSVTVSWLEMPTTGATVQSRQVILQMSKPIGGACSSDRWLPSVPPWQTSDPSPQTVSGLVSGYCYRLVVKLTDDIATTYSQSGTFRVDSQTPMATFITPTPDTITPLPTGSFVVTWAESPTDGAAIVSRRLTTEYGAEPADGTCAGVHYSAFQSTNAASPVTLTGLLPGHCYRFRVELTDSAGRVGTWMSGIMIAPSTFTPAP